MPEHLKKGLLELSCTGNHVFVNAVANNSASLKAVLSLKKVGHIELGDEEIEWLESEEVKKWLESLGYHYS